VFDTATIYAIHFEQTDQLPPSVLQTGAATIEAVVVDAGGNYTRISRSTR
jgi:hypothetical protein